MKRKTIDEIKSLSRVIVAGSMVLSLLPLPTVHGALRDSNDGVESRGVSASQIATAQKASQAAVARMNANIASLGYQSPAVTPGQQALTEIQTTITEMRKPSEKMSVSLPLVNAITVGGLFGQLVELKTLGEMKQTGEYSKVISGKLRDAYGKIEMFKGTVTTDRVGNIKTEIKYADGRKSEASFITVRSAHGNSVHGIVKTTYPGGLCTQYSQVVLDGKGNLDYLKTTIMEKDKVLSSSTSRFVRVSDKHGNVTTHVQTEVIEGKNKTTINYTTDLNGQVIGRSIDYANKIETSFRSVYSATDGRNIGWESESIQTLSDGTVIKTKKVDSDGLVRFETVTRGVMKEVGPDGSITGDWNKNGKVDPGEPWGKFTETTKGTTVRQKDGLLTRSQMEIVFESGAHQTMATISIKEVALYASLAPGLPVQALSRPVEPPKISPFVESKFVYTLPDGSKVNGETLALTDGSYITKSVTVAPNGTQTETVTQASPLQDGVRTVVSTSVSRALNGDVTHSTTYRYVDAKGVPVIATVVQFAKQLTDGTTVTGETITQKDGSYVSKSITVKKDGTRVESKTSAGPLVNGWRAVVTESITHSPNGDVTHAVTHQSLDAQGNLGASPKVTRFSKSLADGSNVTGETITQKDGSYISTSVTIKKDGTRIETVTYGVTGKVVKIDSRSLFPDGKIALSRLSYSYNSSGQLVGSVRIEEVIGSPTSPKTLLFRESSYDAQGRLTGYKEQLKDLTSRQVRSVLARFNASGQLVGFNN